MNLILHMIDSCASDPSTTTTPTTKLKSTVNLTSANNLMSNPTRKPNTTPTVLHKATSTDARISTAGPNASQSQEVSTNTEKDIHKERLGSTTGM